MRLLLEGLRNFMIANRHDNMAHPTGLNQRLRILYLSRSRQRTQGLRPMRHQLWKKYEDRDTQDQ